MANRAVFTVTSGPNAGDRVSLERGSCRLVGRHLSESETALIDRDGNRILDGTAAKIISGRLQEKAPPMSSTKSEFSATTFERGPDIVLADTSISRAHAMVFYDGDGLGILDLASTNGTILNETAVSSAVIAEGDLISLGKTSLIVTLE